MKLVASGPLRLHGGVPWRESLRQVARRPSQMRQHGRRYDGGQRYVAACVRRRLACIAALVVALVVALSVAVDGAQVCHAGDPKREWKTIETSHFVIHYYEPLGRVAQRVAEVGEYAHAILAPRLDHTPSEKCQVLLVDDTDGANGFASVLPRNAITLFATAPGDESVLSDHDDWLYGLVAHEYTHILHLDTMTGLPKLYNAIFGKTWAPNQIMPRWLIEGIATYEESKQSSSGRTRASTFDMYLRAALLAQRPIRLDETTGAPRRFPRGNVAYLYGSHFLKYVFDRFGEDTLRQMIHAGGAYPVPFAVNRQIAQVVGKSFDALYDDWLGHLRDKYALQAQAVERAGLRAGTRVTFSGEANLQARFSADGREIIWFQSDGHSRPRMRSMPRDGDAHAAREVFAADGLGLVRMLPDGGAVYEQSQIVRREYAFQDLYWWDKRTGTTTRLTWSERARDPAVSPDGRWIAYSRNGNSSSEIVVMPFAAGAPGRVIWRGQDFEQAYHPAWTPDGRALVFSAWRRGGLRDLLMTDIASGATRELTHDRALDGAPWVAPDGRYVYFDSDRTGITNIFAYDLRDDSIWQVTNVLGAAFEPAVSPDGKTLVYQGFRDRGFDIYRLTIDPSQWQRAEPYFDDRPDATVVPSNPQIATAPRPYRALATLAPQSYVLQTQFASTALSATVQTGGSDVAGLHAYSLAAGVNLTDGTSNLGGSWSYNRWRQFLRLAVSRSHVTRTGYKIDGVAKDWREEQWSGTLAVGIPTETRSDAAWGFSFDYDIDYNRVTEAPVAPLDPTQRIPQMPLSNYRQAGLALRANYGNLRGFTFSVGPQRGWDVSLSMRMDHPWLGATYRNLTFSYAARAFLALPLTKSSVLAVRASGAVRSGDLIRSGGFGLGGVPAQDVVSAIINSTRFSFTGYLRGYAERTVAGNQYHLANLELRQEGWVIERGLSTLPIYLRRLTLAALLDAGAAWDGNLTGSQTRVAVGGALRLDAFFGYFVPGTFELGYARGLVNGGIDETWLLLTGSL